MSQNFRTLLTAVLLMAASAVGFAQTQLTVHGKVTDPSGAPVAGASVIVVGTMNGTSADGNGNYVLTKVASDAVIAASFIGYTSVEEAVKGRTVVDIILSEDSELLEEIVVVGYGQMKKSDLTGSVASVKTESITNVPANSIESLMQGRIAGVQITNNSQEPGASSVVRVRGSSSMRGSNAPLLVVDGFPIGEAGNLSEVNPQDIVSMEVLKDASASAIYGSRGANGVILITTNRADAGKTTVSVRQQTTVSQMTSELDLWRDPVLMAITQNEAKVNAGLTPTYIGAVNANGVYYPSIEELQTTWTTNTRWEDIVGKTSS